MDNPHLIRELATAAEHQNGCALRDFLQTIPIEEQFRLLKEAQKLNQQDRAKNSSIESFEVDADGSHLAVDGASVALTVKPGSWYSFSDPMYEYRVSVDNYALSTDMSPSKTCSP